MEKHSHAKNQHIYDASRNRPKEGYGDSDKFRLASVLCPQCSGPCWVRVRARFGTTIGVVCADCNWRSTFPQHAPIDDPPLQLEAWQLPGGNAAVNTNPSNDHY